LDQLYPLHIGSVYFATKMAVAKGLVETLPYTYSHANVWRSKQKCWWLMVETRINFNSKTEIQFYKVFIIDSLLLLLTDWTALA